MGSSTIGTAANALRGKPWNDADGVPDEIYRPLGMLGPEERRCLFHLARAHYSGRGALVDAGAFLGASAYALAAGLSASPHAGAEHARVHSFDYFRAVDDYVASFIGEHVRPIRAGESFLDVFEAQTADLHDTIETTAGDFTEARWDGTPIEILFIDVAKTLELHSHLVDTFFPHMIPGQTVVIQQDYHHAWHPYIHVGMEALADHFELVDPLVEHQSRVWLCTSQPTGTELQRVADFDFSPEERLALLDQAMQSSPPPSTAMLKVVRLWDAYLVKDEQRTAEYIRELDAERGDGVDVWWVQYEQVKQWIDTHGF